MKSKKMKKALEVYSLIGKAMCASAGAIIGFVVGGPMVAVGGIFIGTILGHLLGKNVLKVTS